MAPQTGEETAKVGSRFLYSAAEAKARSAGADEALLVDAGGRPVEGAKSNLFVATDDAIITPPVEAGPLAGVARRTVLEIARNEGIPVRQRPIEREELETARPFSPTLCGRFDRSAWLTDELPRDPRRSSPFFAKPFAGKCDGH